MIAVVFLLILLVVSVLGSIVGGIAAPTEAASMGAVGAVLEAEFGASATEPFSMTSPTT